MIYLQDPDVTLYHGDVLAVLRELPAESVDCVVTSPPYWGLRDYGTGAWDGGDEGCDHLASNYDRGVLIDATQRTTPGGASAATADKRRTPYRDTCGKCGATRIDQQLGLESTPEEYVTRMVEVFREVRRVLAAHGTVWLNLGDSYAAARSYQVRDNKHTEVGNNMASEIPAGLKQKDLVGIPWRVAFALQADGWYLRSDIIWAKPNPMPESVTDRPTKAHEYVFLLSKQPRYFFDQEAVREAAQWERWGDQTVGAGSNPNGWIKPRSKESLTWDERKDAGEPLRQGLDGKRVVVQSVAERNQGRNIRSVWEIATQPYPEAHFATFPEELARRCIAAGCPEQVCRVCGKPAGAEIVRTPLGNGSSIDPTPLTGRKGMNRERRADEGTRPISKAEQRDYAQQLRESPWRPQMEAEAGPAFAHYVRTDDSGARPLPPDLLDAWVQRGWLTAAEASGCGHDDYQPGTVLDPFIGSGTVAHVARKLGRHAVGIDLNESYLELAARRLQQQSFFAEASGV